MYKAKELRDQTNEELQALLLDLKKGIFKMRNDIRLTKKNENPQSIKNNRRDVARIHTIVRERAIKQQETRSA